MQACINGATTRPYALEEDLVAAGAAGFPLVEIWAGKLQTYLEQPPSLISADPWRRQASP